ncbi:LysM peptidoglycan-binding domain-containing protein [Amylibacter sp.]|jgi:nucleoid-associated protein YgaU|nr:LysM peptidoglycan-binding domain-containing protein [Amylibacter sp.]MDB2559546.1 LysM peptidoglycan-binding domain-containing protein [Amylibacter sp.]MDB2563968.1 LysM peptidoglycan-binding domain-containing protein [Amylibacter sp.]MDC3322528.1 LysM peptidoglycan-binding domain-containing protein [Amylibacter sp.]
MNAKKTEILKLKESSRVKKTFGNRSEDKVILSFAAAFAVLAIFFIVMETVDEDNLDIVKVEVNEAVSNEAGPAEVKSIDQKEIPAVKGSIDTKEEINKSEELPTTKEEVVESVELPVAKKEASAVVAEPIAKDNVSTEKEEPATKNKVTTAKVEPVTKDKVTSSEEEAASMEETLVVTEENIIAETEAVIENNPAFDLVRVDEDGSAIIAGSAKPNSEVRLLVDGKELETAETDASGAFAILTTIPSGEKPLELQLEDVNDSNIKSADTVLIIPNKEAEASGPKIIIAESDGKIIVQEQNDIAPKIQPLSLDTINYAASGDVILAGRASSEQIVRVYVDNKPVVLGEVTDGKWNFEIPNIEEGIYTLRVDAINNEGKVVDRVESPFQRVIREMEDGQATIQPGFTLWKLAELKYGFGMRYVQIFEANRDSIKDPDLIYPGQVFQIPEK